MGSSTDNQAITVFVLGLLSIVTCQILGPVAVIMGGRYVAECKAEGRTPEGLGVAGRVMGFVGTALLALQLLVVLLYAALVVAVVISEL